MKGSVVYLFAYDVANEISTGTIRTLLGEPTFPFQIRVGGTAPRDMPIYHPLTVTLKPETIESNLGRMTLRRTVKVFEIGIVSISFEVPFDVGSLEQLVPYHRIASGGEDLAHAAEHLCARVIQDLRPSLVKASEGRTLEEAYTVFCLERLGEERSVSLPGWCTEYRASIAALLCEESDAARLAPSQVEETLRHQLSYTTADLAIIDWDAALVVDESGYTDDVLYMIELANLQLEEFRLLDDRLDRYFLRAYDDLDGYYSRPGLLRSPVHILRTLRAIRMDTTKISEEVTHITKFVGDWYLARVYLACKDRFHLAHWEASVDQKLRQLDEIYSIVQSEIGSRRMLLLEVTIVALFILDVALLLIRR